MGHRTAPMRRATTAAIPGVIGYQSWSSTRIATYTYNHMYCCMQGYTRITGTGFNQ